MASASLTPTTFYATSSAGLLAGTVTYSGNTATLTLATAPSPSTLITGRVLSSVTATDGKAMAADYLWTFTTSSTVDTVAPTLDATDPVDAATGVATNKSLSAVFSEAMLPSSMNVSTFKVTGPSGNAAGTVTTVGNTAQFKPATALAAMTTYTARISTGAQDLSGNGLVADRTWTFTTGATADVTAPTIVSTDPGDHAIGVRTNKAITASFSEAMDVSTLTPTSFVLKRSDGMVVPAKISHTINTAVLTPNSVLAANTMYVATVTTNAKDLAGNSLAASQSWSFTTSNSSDSVPPTVVSTNPQDKSVNIAINKSVNVTFSEPMLPTSINSATFKVQGVTGTVSYDTATDIVTFKPTSDLAPNTTFTATVSTGVRDAAGNSLALPKVWSFTTGTQRAQITINFGSASSYAVLAGSTITNIGPTVINGDLGVSPGTAVVGFPPGVINGAIHTGDAAAAMAKTDLLAGQLDASSRLGAATLPGDLGGLTFTPGLYKNSTSVMISSGALTLDAQGDADAVFIFQMGSTLTTSPGTQVVLAGGAKASNIYWSVGTSATLGVNSIFKGVILAEVSITVNNGATHDGTLLTKTGAVTLEANTVTRNVRRNR